jgi:hypothetical protein
VIITSSFHFTKKKETFPEEKKEKKSFPESEMSDAFSSFEWNIPLTPRPYQHRYDPFDGIRGAASVPGSPPTEGETRRKVANHLIVGGGNLYMSEDVAFKISFFDSLKMTMHESGITIPHNYTPMCVCGLPTLRFDFPVTQKYDQESDIKDQHPTDNIASTPPAYSYTSEGYLVAQFAIGYLVESDEKDEVKMEVPPPSGKDTALKDRNFYWGSDARYAALRQMEEVYGNWSVLASGEHGGGMAVKRRRIRKKGLVQKGEREAAHRKQRKWKSESLQDVVAEESRKDEIIQEKKRMRVWTGDKKSKVDDEDKLDCLGLLGEDEDWGLYDDTFYDCNAVFDTHSGPASLSDCSSDDSNNFFPPHIPSELLEEKSMNGCLCIYQVYYNRAVPLLSQGAIPLAHHLHRYFAPDPITAVTVVDGGR